MEFLFEIIGLTFTIHQVSLRPINQDNNEWIQKNNMLV